MSSTAATRGFALLFSLLVVCSPVVALLTTTGLAAGASSPDIATSPASLDFGEVTVGSETTKNLTVVNNGSATLNVTNTTVTGLNASEFYIVAGGAPFSLAPNESTEIAVGFTPASAGMKTGDLVLESNDPDEGIYSIPLSGNGSTNGTLAGFVVNNSDGSAIASADVVVFDNNGNVIANATTNVSGAYSTAVLEGSWEVRANATGYVAQSVAPVNVTTGNTTTLDFALSPEGSATTGALSGIVFNNSSGIEISGANITVANGTGVVVATAITDANGSYSVDIGEGTYDVEANATGYISQTATANVVAGETKMLDFALDPESSDGTTTGTLTGLVFNNSSGTEISGANITAFDGAGAVVATATTDANGSYVVDIAEGTYDVEANATGYVVDTALAVNVTTGTTTVQDFALAPETSGESTNGTITGVVNNSSGSAIEGAEIAVMDGASVVVGTTVTDVSGNYSIDVPEGTYDVEANATGYVSETVLGINVTAGSTTVLDFALYPESTDGSTNGTLTGTVFNNSSGTEISGAEIAVLDGTGTAVATVTTDANGSYVVDIVEGTYDVEANATGYLSATALSVNVTAGSTTVQDFELDPEPSSSDSTGTIEGAVVNNSSGVGVSGAEVIVRDGSGLVVANTTTDGAGNYSIAVPEGTFDVEANATGYVSEVAVGVNVTASTTTVQDFALDPESSGGEGATTGTLTGVVYNNSTGTGISGANITVFDGTGTATATATTDANGSYVLDLVEGTYDVEANATGYVVETVIGVGVMAGSTTVQDFALAPELSSGDSTGTLAGTVFNNSSGVGIAGAAVVVYDGSGAVVANATTDSGGNYSVGLVEGSYGVEVSATGYLTATATVNVTANTTTLRDFGLVSEASDGTTGAISGTVVNNSSGTAIEGAEITVVDGSGTYVASAISDIDGNYTVSVAEGTYGVEANATGYVLTSTVANITANNTTMLDFALAPESSDGGSDAPTTGTVAGVVINNSSGAGIGGADVVVYDDTGTVVANVTADGSGNYSVELAEGLYGVEASATGYGTVSTPVNVTVNNTTTLDFALDPEASGGDGSTTGTLAGMVVNSSSGVGIGNADVVALDSSGTPVGSTLTDSGGNYSLGLAEGTYDVWVNATDYDGSLLSGISVTANNTTSLDVSLQPATNGGDHSLPAAPWVSIRNQTYDSTVDSVVMAGYNATGQVGAVSDLAVRLVNASDGSPIAENGSLTVTEGSVELTIPNRTIRGDVPVEVRLVNATSGTTLASDTATLSEGSGGGSGGTDSCSYTVQNGHGTNANGNVTAAAVSVVSGPSLVAGACLYPEAYIDSQPMLQFNVRANGTTGSYELNTTGITHDTVLRIDLTINGSFTPRMPLGAANITEWTVADNGDGTRNVTIYLSPVEQQMLWVDSDGDGFAGETPDMSTWPDPAETDQANDMTQVGVGTAISDLGHYSASHQQNFTGTVIATDAQAFADPMYYPSTAGGDPVLQLEVAGPHLTMSGVQNNGFFDVYLPNSVLQEWGVLDPAQLGASFNGTDVSISAIQVDGGIWVRADIHYSSGDVNISASQDGATDTIAPTADAGSDISITGNQSLSFDGSGSSDNVGVDSYEWDFGDGTTDTGATPSHTYTSAGNYTVTLTVTEAAGNTDTDTLTVTVSDTTTPTASLSANTTSVAVGDTIGFDASGSSDDLSVDTYEWDFGDGTTDTGVTATHGFATPGTYTVTLNVSDAGGNWNTDSVTVTVTDITDPTADAGTDTSTTAGTAVSLDGTASRDNVGLTGYTWTFADGTTKTGSVVSHTFDTAGTYTAMLNVTDAAGNWDTDTVAITVTKPSTSDGTSDITTDSTSTLEESTTSENETDETTTVTVTVNRSAEADSSNVSITNATVNEPVTVDLGTNETETANDSVALDGLNVTLTKHTSLSLSVSVSEESPTSELTTDLRETGSTDALGYLTVAHDVPDEGIGDVSFAFRVSKQRVADRGTSPADLVLYRFHDGKWNALETTLTGETETQYVFRADSPGLSVFAIGTRGPKVDITDLALSADRVQVGQTVTVGVTVENTGTTTGSTTLTLVEAGEQVAERPITIPAGQTLTVPLEAVFNDPGTYTLSVHDQTAGTVIVEAATTPTATETTNDDVTTASQPPQTETTPSSADGPGFGIAAALGALLGGGLLSGRLRRRRR